MNEYGKIGSVTYIDGKPYFKFDYTDNGFVFKDEEAYEKDWNAPCYVPEFAKGDFYDEVYDCYGDHDECDWYSHNDLLELCHYNHKICDDMFSCLDWSYPETWLNDDIIDYNDAYDFVKQGAEVFWNDPDHDFASGFQTVDLLPEDEEWGADSVVTLASGTEVPLHELTQFCPHAKLYGQAVRDLAVMKSWVKESKTLDEFKENAEAVGAECFTKDEDFIGGLFGVIQFTVYIDENDNLRMSPYVDIWDEENREWYMESAHIPDEELAKYE